MIIESLYFRKGAEEKYSDFEDIQTLNFSSTQPSLDGLFRLSFKHNTNLFHSFVYVLGFVRQYSHFNNKNVFPIFYCQQFGLPKLFLFGTKPCHK